MRADDYVGLALSVGFGLWWALFPENVIRFYTRFPRGKLWLYKGKVSVPKPLVVRMIGVLWIALVFGVFLHKLR